MTDVVIVADDLTGAADSAALLTRRGATAVVVDPEARWPVDATTLAIDTDGRHRDAASAADRAATAAARARELGAEVVKKIDSTLRGHIASELRAMREVLTPGGRRMLMVVAPAFPSNGRTTRGGVVHVEGRPLAAHGSDGDVVGLLGRGGLSARAVARDALLGDRLIQAHADGLDAIVVDAENDGDLADVVLATRNTPVPVLLVGSGGITRPLAGTPQASYAVSPPLTGPTLVVVGSHDEVSHRQREQLVRHGLAHVVLRDPDLTATELLPVLAQGVAVLSPDPTDPVEPTRSTEVAFRLAETVVAVLPEVGTLVATGGQTARAILVAADVTRYPVTGEVEPGIVRGHLPELGIDLITKGGGFGDPDALLRCLPASTHSASPRERGTTR